MLSALTIVAVVACCWQLLLLLELRWNKVTENCLAPIGVWILLLVLSPAVHSNFLAVWSLAVLTSRSLAGDASSWTLFPHYWKAVRYTSLCCSAGAFATPRFLMLCRDCLFRFHLVGNTVLISVSYLYLDW